ncbi:glycosyltransferase family 1 protein [Rhizobium sp. BK376]|uniref:glycosyltransferase family 4 protein n=1 Tax=Rhizobium sp. BK376 TaxID=2512149 RepID=UPI001046CC85|nr:glycosyltransferase family 1 protein [Rhizobium sp. BK376]TCR71860.1 glycosyltransferase involved in cell wall biosynthesis [Rhizobium sp. BK376]
MSRIILTDPRWPSNTGIGQVYTEHLKRKPSEIAYSELSIKGSVADPLAPWHIGNSINKFRGQDVVFWNPGFVPPVRAIGKCVVTVHDLSHLHHYGRLKKLYYEEILKRLYPHCASIICVSRTARDEFVEWSGVDERKVNVIYNGVDARFSPNGSRLADAPPYVLYPGNHRNYKNLGRLVAAYGKSRLPALGVELWLTGSSNVDLTSIAATYNASEKLRFLGRVPDESMPELYRSAYAVAFVSLYEGFGLPLLEGMASNVPVLTSNLSCMPEIANGAALLVNPLNEDEIADGLNRIVHDEALRRRLIIAGAIRAEEMSWDRSSLQLWELLSGVDAE